MKDPKPGKTRGELNLPVPKEGEPLLDPHTKAMKEILEKIEQDRHEEGEEGEPPAGA